MILRLLSIVFILQSVSVAEEVKDVRQRTLKDLNGYFPFSVPADQESWAARRTGLRRDLQVALGLYPLPVRSELNPVVHGRRDMGDYFVEKVYFESFPGFYVTGSLYRPKGVQGRVPAVLCPHGHWPDGRFMDATSGVEKEMKSGAEEFANAARNPLQARCVHLARMGCVVFHYDMLGYADSQQLSMALAHKFSEQKAATVGGFYTAQAEGQLQSILGLQTWHGIRALDFLETLQDVDPKRIGVTGASGGGTQTFLLCALDDRPAAAFPAVMVTTAMQGGCTCENASLLRTRTGNVEIAALFAPKPLGMTAADDWTKEMPSKGFPELKQLYQLLGHPDQVSLTALLQFPHNYNRPSRAAMEAWFAKHLLNATSTPEKDFTFLTAADLTVWDATHPAPEAGPKAEREVLNQWAQANQAAFEKDPAAREAGWKSIVGRNLQSTGKVTWVLSGEKIDGERFFKISGEILNSTHQEVVKATFLHPKNWNKNVAVWVTEIGSTGMFGTDGQPLPEVAKLLAQGWAVAGPDLLLQQDKVLKNARVANPREAPSYTYGYNHPLFIQRVHDVLSVVQMIKTNPDYATEKIALCAGKGGDRFVGVAGFAVGRGIDASVFTAAGSEFSLITDVFAADFLPGALKYGDLPVLEKLNAHRKSMAELLDLK